MRCSSWTTPAARRSRARSRASAGAPFGVASVKPVTPSAAARVPIPARSSGESDGDASHEVVPAPQAARVPVDTGLLATRRAPKPRIAAELNTHNAPLRCCTRTGVSGGVISSSAARSRSPVADSWKPTTRSHVPVRQPIARGADRGARRGRALGLPRDRGMTPRPPSARRCTWWSCNPGSTAQDVASTTSSSGNGCSRSAIATIVSPHRRTSRRRPGASSARASSTQRSAASDFATAAIATSTRCPPPAASERNAAAAANSPVIGSAIASPQNTGAPAASYATKPPATAASSPNATWLAAGTRAAVSRDRHPGSAGAVQRRTVWRRCPAARARAAAMLRSRHRPGRAGDPARRALREHRSRAPPARARRAATRRNGDRRRGHHRGDACSRP